MTPTNPTRNTPNPSALLATLAGSDPDFAAFSAHSGASFRDLGASALPEPDATALAHATLAVLREDPQRAQRLDLLARSPAPGRFDGGALGVPLLLAVTFLLRTAAPAERRCRGAAKAARTESIP